MVVECGYMTVPLKDLYRVVFSLLEIKTVTKQWHSSKSEKHWTFCAAHRLLQDLNWILHHVSVTICPASPQLMIQPTSPTNSHPQVRMQTHMALFFSPTLRFGKMGYGQLLVLLLLKPLFSCSGKYFSLLIWELLPSVKSFWGRQICETQTCCISI